jgi:hypothetical protein
MTSTAVVAKAKTAWENVTALQAARQTTHEGTNQELLSCVQGRKNNGWRHTSWSRKRSKTPARRNGDGSVIRRVAGLQTVTGYSISPGPNLEIEKLEAPLQDQERTCNEQRQRRLDAVLADQHKPRQQKVFWEGNRDDRDRGGVMGSLKRRPTSQNPLKICQERRRRRLRSGQELAWQDRLGTENSLSWGEIRVLPPRGPDTKHHPGQVLVPVHRGGSGPQGVLQMAM